ncbi:MAG: GFA family protein [Alphaproteobacteria bacterium]|nr:GFA family protein [Alphaproteobacteria bacterium]MCB9930947.1 GFA family protein [Alphaproteobacteria bacterium]
MPEAAPTNTAAFSAEGGCTCGAVRFRLTARPLVVHGCHCRWCQRETGSALAINAMIERDRLEVLAGETEDVLTPSASGKGQRVHRCPTCKVALWSHYAGAGPTIAFVRVGTLDEPDRLPPDFHIFTASKQPWLTLPAGARSFPDYYNPREVWPAETLQRFKAARKATG